MSPFFFILSSTTPTRMLVPPMSAARMASWPASTQLGASCTAPIRPALSGWLVIVRSSTAMLSPASSTAARPIASSPMWLALKPPPITMRSVPCHFFSRRKRRTTVASSTANSSTAVWTRPGRQRIGAGQHLVELRLGDLPGRRVAERILALRAQLVAPIVEDGAEGAAAGAIADEAVLVAQLLVIGVDGDGRQHAAAVARGPPTVAQARGCLNVMPLSGIARLPPRIVPHGHTEVNGRQRGLRA